MGTGDLERYLDRPVRLNRMVGIPLPYPPGNSRPEPNPHGLNPVLRHLEHMFSRQNPFEVRSPLELPVGQGGINHPIEPETAPVAGGFAPRGAVPFPVEGEDLVWLDHPAS